MEEGETENQRERAARGELGLTSLALKREKRVILVAFVRECAVDFYTILQRNWAVTK